MAIHDLSPEKYLRSGRARKLPIDACYINEGWKESGLAHIIIIRKHVNGRFTVGIYLVDLLALGTKDTFFLFNSEEEELEPLLNVPIELERVEYTLVHNIIYGANAFAEEHGFSPCREFALTRHILEEDTEEIELIELEFGEDGKPLIIMADDADFNDEE